jgi:hypothetical protein
VALPANGQLFGITGTTVRFQPESLSGITGLHILAEMADDSGLTGAMSVALAPMCKRRRRHDPGRVLVDLAIMIASGGDVLARAKNETHHQALRAVANRLVGLLHGCLRNRTAYDAVIAWHREVEKENENAA